MKLKRMAAGAVVVAMLLAGMASALGAQYYSDPITVEVVIPAEPSPEPTEEARITYQRDETGALVLGENGDPIAIVPGGMEHPVSYQRDESGALVLDANGDPVPLYTLPDGSTQIGSIVDLLDPNRRIDLFLITPADEVYFGHEATMAALLYGYDNAVYTLQWETSADGESWQAVEGGADSRLTVIVTEENHRNLWRVSVTITDVAENTETQAPGQ